MASSAEREIRDALVDWWHKHHPRGRVVHELPLSSFSGVGRADLGIIFPDVLVVQEIKSERDKLTRLEKQFKAMSAIAHHWHIVCHEKWFGDSDCLKGQHWMNYAHQEHVWRYPEPAVRRWEYQRYSNANVPHNLNLLELLHRSELLECYAQAGMAVSSNGLGREGLKLDLHDRLSGRQVREAVCAALRTRTFAEADDPVSHDGRVA